MTLVSGWRRAWRWFSIQSLAALALLPLVWAELPPDLKDWIPPDWRPWILGAIALAGIAGRLIDQEPRT